jgi:hypothetical protein
VASHVDGNVVVSVYTSSAFSVLVWKNRRMMPWTINSKVKTETVVGKHDVGQAILMSPITEETGFDVRVLEAQCLAHPESKCTE